MHRFVTLLTLGILVSSCASAPKIHYYTLDMTPSGATDPAVNVVVDRIRVSESLSRKDILIKQSVTEIEYYAANQWAAGLDELIAEKLDVEFGPWREDRATVHLIGTILAFEQVDVPSGAEAHAKIAFTFQPETEDRYADPALAKTYDVRVPADGAGAAATVRALSTCVERIASEIARDAAQLP